MLQIGCRRALLYAWARPANTLGRVHEACAFQPWRPVSRFSSGSIPRRGEDGIALRKQLKDAAKTKKSKQSQDRSPSPRDAVRAADWELTVGIEIHAQLNTARKLFSSELSGHRLITATDPGRCFYIRDRQAQ